MTALALRDGAVGDLEDCVAAFGRLAANAARLTGHMRVPLLGQSRDPLWPIPKSVICSITQMAKSMLCRDYMPCRRRVRQQDLESLSNLHTLSPDCHT